MSNSRLRLVPPGATSGTDLLELVGKQYAADPSYALQWVALVDPEGNDADNVAKFEATGWERIKEGGIDVSVMGMLLMRKDRAAVEAERQAAADKGEKNWADAVERFAGMGGTVKSTWKPGDKR